MVLLYLFAFVVLLNCVYFLLFSKFSFLSPINEKKHHQKSLGAVSLIICAKNETENLLINIPHWLQQDYPNFEIILINNASIDNTLEVMNSFAKKDPRIKIVDVENNEAFWANKKYALTLGIKRANNRYLIFTDADCKPASKKWLKEMTSLFTLNKQLILGFGAYDKLPGFLNKLIRFETLMTATQYFSYAVAGMPYMGVGRNLGYTSNLYFDNNGFTSHINVPSGDDDLFVNEAATKDNTAICFSKNSFTYSSPKKSWKAWFIQKKRHFSTAKYYKYKHKLLLGFYFITQVLFWVLGGVTLLTLDWKIPVILISFRFLLQFVIIGKAAIKLKGKDLIPFLPFLELFLIFLQLSIFITNSTSNPTKWK